MFSSIHLKWETWFSDFFMYTSLKINSNLKFLFFLQSQNKLFEVTKQVVWSYKTGFFLSRKTGLFKVAKQVCLHKVIKQDILPWQVRTVRLRRLLLRPAKMRRRARTRCATRETRNSKISKNLAVDYFCNLNYNDIEQYSSLKLVSLLLSCLIVFMDL